MGFPIQKSADQTIICISPQLIAAYHVFHRLLVPRHSPCALFSLTVLYAFLILLICQQDQNKIVVINNIFTLYLISQLLFSFQGASANYQLRFHSYVTTKVVGSSGLEPPTSRLSGARSNHLSYEPIWWR